jgi:Cys-tRNA(Pro)/Cys-tRNA(Cys) deacylase
MAKQHAKPSGTPALVVLNQAGTPHTVHDYGHDPRSKQGYGIESAEALGIDPARVFKTLMVSADGELVVGVVPVAGHLDLKALAAAVGAKRAEMADPAVAQRATGYVLGGISPLGQKKSHRTVIDDSAEPFDTMFVSAGARGLSVEIAPADLAALTKATFAPIGKPGHVP